jgi:type I restriction enzyme S subunit
MGADVNVPKLRFPEFNNSWKVKKLSDVARIVTGSTPNTKINEFYNGDRLFVSPTDINNNRLVNKTKTTLTEIGFREGRKIEKGSVMFVCIGSTIGKVAIAGADCITNQQINSLSCIENYFNSFLFSLLERNSEKIKIKAGVQALPIINKTDFSNFIFKFPEINEQTKIASFLTAVDDKLQALKKKKELLEQYKKGMMQQLFSQEIRFKKDDGTNYPDWEEKKLGELCEVKKGQQLNKEELTVTGKYPCINGGINPSGYTDKFNTSENTITISEGGNSCGYINFFKVKFWSGGHNYSIEISEPAVTENTFLFQLLKFNEVSIMKLRVGSGLPNIQKKDLVSFVLSFPKSIEEQTKIANFLSSIDDKIAYCQSELDGLEQWKKGLLQQLFC